MAKKYFRNQQKRSVYLHNIQDAFRRMFTNARRFGWSQSFLLEKRQELFNGDGVITSAGQWEMLTCSEQAECFGYWNALSDTLMDGLEFRYLIGGKWYTPKEVCDHKDGTDSSRDIPSPANNAHYVHIVNTESGPVYRIYS